MSKYNVDDNSSPKHLIPYTEGKWSKYDSHMVFPKKVLQL